jgi:DNA-binding response OmpR family regulator
LPPVSTLRRWSSATRNENLLSGAALQPMVNPLHILVDNYLAKPFKMQELKNIITETLDQTNAAP